jgi:hypothetical protein
MEVLFYDKGQHCRKKPPNLNNGKYCPHLVIKGQKEYLGVQFIHGEEKIVLGEITEALAECVYEDIDYELLRQDVSFFVMEGPHRVGEGKVLERHDGYSW